MRIVFISSIAAADGYGEILITQRPIVGSMTLESELSSVIDPDTLLSAGTRFAWSAGALFSIAVLNASISGLG